MSSWPFLSRRQYNRLQLWRRSPALPGQHLQGLPRFVKEMKLRSFSVNCKLTRNSIHRREIRHRVSPLPPWLLVQWCWPYLLQRLCMLPGVLLPGRWVCSCVVEPKYSSSTNFMRLSRWSVPTKVPCWNTPQWNRGHKRYWLLRLHPWILLPWSKHHRYQHVYLSLSSSSFLNAAAYRTMHLLH